MPKTFHSPETYRRREAYLHIHDIPHLALNTYRFMKKRGYGEPVVIATSLREAWKHLAATAGMAAAEARKTYRLVEIRRPLAEGRRRIERL